MEGKSANETINSAVFLDLRFFIIGGTDGVYLGVGSEHTGLGYGV